MNSKIWSHVLVSLISLIIIQADGELKVTKEDLPTRNINKRSTSPIRKFIFESGLEAQRSFHEAERSKPRSKRHQLFGLHNVPVLRSFYGGDDRMIDYCPRDEIWVPSAKGCYKLHCQGPCGKHEMVLMHHETHKGYCAPRICNPDRIFVHNSQKCHDPHEPGLCPPGRRLFTTAYGNAVCGCPYGTFALSDATHLDVCVPYMGTHEVCNEGEVFWTDSIREKPTCRPDPCQGLNVEREQSLHPFVHSKFDGRCHQLGVDHPKCPDGEHYSLSLEQMRGVCLDLVESGYVLLDGDTNSLFKGHFGHPIPRDTHYHGPPSQQCGIGQSSIGQTNFISQPQSSSRPQGSYGAGHQNQPHHHHHFIWQSFFEDLGNSPASQELGLYDLPELSGHHPIMFIDVEDEYRSKRHSKRAANFNTNTSRRKRNSDSSAYNSAMNPCTPGAANEFNGKCQNQSAPSKSRVKRNSQQTPPQPDCPGGYGINNQCKQGGGGGGSDNPFG